MSPRARRGLALLSGLLCCLSFPSAVAMGFEAWPGRLAWVALVPLLLALDGQGRRQGFQLGLIAGLAFFVPGLHWLTKVQPLGGGAWPAWLALAAWCALFVGLFGALAAEGRRRGWPQPLLWLPAAWTLVEWLRLRLLTGFPWMSLGGSQFANPALRPLAALTGSAGLHYAVALGNGLVFTMLFRPKQLCRWSQCLPAVAVALALAGGAAWQARAQAAWTASQAGAPTVRVAVVQGGLDLDQVYTAAFRAKVLGLYLGYSGQAAAAGAKLIVWPESAFPGFFNEDGPEAQALKAFARRRRVSLVFGSVLSTPHGYQNAAVCLDPDGNTRSYAKRHLVPFGEYLPLAEWVPGLRQALGDMGVAFFQPGESGAGFRAQGLAVAPMICFESVFPELAHQDGPPDLVAIITVDTWYGVSSCPIYHASQAGLRAVENGCWVARAAATGVSLFAGPDGQLGPRLGLDGAGWILQDLGPGRPTPYARWGDWFTVACGMGLLLAAVLAL
ncbi:MAG TPA: apolipoprotein N-acyltransferase [bacterium]|nr:apolipoprotein N-acyltransferase [bacterium]